MAIRTLMDHFGFHNRTQTRNTVLLIVISLAAPAAVTLAEDRFLLRSVTGDAPGIADTRILGMSFLGDPMVWLFTLLLPLCFHLTKSAIDRTRAVLDTLMVVDANNVQQDLKGIETETLAFLDSAQTATLIRRCALAVGLLFWVYNSVTCVWPTLGGLDIYPYQSNDVYISNQDPDAWQAHDYIDDVHIPKWDTDLANAPWSTLTTRVWALIFYTATPILIGELLLYIIGFARHMRAIRRKIKEAAYDLLLEPFSTDRFGGLKRLSSVGMSFFHAAIALCLLPTISLMKEATEPSWHNYLLVGLLLPIALGLFFYPSYLVRELIVQAKEDKLKTLATALRETEQKVLTESDPNHDARLGTLMSLSKDYQNILEWPFSASNTLRLVAGALTPLAILGIDKFILTPLMSG